MTISSQTRKTGTFVGSGSTGPFAFAFKIFQPSDMLVVKVNTTTSVETTLTLTTDFTVSMNFDQDSNPGGNVTLVVALAVGNNMVMSSQIPYLQETDLTNQGGFYPEVITSSLGGRITYGNFYTPVIINYLGGWQGQPGGTPRPLRNKF